MRRLRSGLHGIVWHDISMQAVPKEAGQDVGKSYVQEVLHCQR